MIDSLLSTELAVTALVSGLSLLAVWIPFYRGLKLTLRARAATRRVSRSALVEGSASAESEIDNFSLLMARVLRKSLRESQGHPAEFVIDATRQYVQNEYDTHYSCMISMYANLLPPIGFIGTTTGMLILFFSMHASSSSLELGALALALTSSIFALVGFAVLEALKIRLYGRLLLCLGDAASLGRTSVAKQAQRQRTAAVAG
jgi:hypothetical protein